jgi:hypothetical protein
MVYSPIHSQGSLSMATSSYVSSPESPVSLSSPSHEQESFLVQPSAENQLQHGDDGSSSTGVRGPIPAYRRPEGEEQQTTAAGSPKPNLAIDLQRLPHHSGDYDHVPSHMHSDEGGLYSPIQNPSSVSARTSSYQSSRGSMMSSPVLSPAHHGEFTSPHMDENDATSSPSPSQQHPRRRMPAPIPAYELDDGNAIFANPPHAQSESELASNEWAVHSPMHSPTSATAPTSSYMSSSCASPTLQSPTTDAHKVAPYTRGGSAKSGRASSARVASPSQRPNSQGGSRVAYSPILSRTSVSNVTSSFDESEQSLLIHEDTHDNHTNTNDMNTDILILEEEDDDAPRRRILSAGTRETIAQLVEEGRTLLDALGEEVTGQIADTIRESRSKSPIAAVLRREATRGVSQDVHGDQQRVHMTSPLGDEHGVDDESARVHHHVLDEHADAPEKAILEGQDVLHHHVQDDHADALEKVILESQEVLQRLDSARARSVVDGKWTGYADEDVVQGNMPDSESESNSAHHKSSQDIPSLNIAALLTESGGVAVHQPSVAAAAAQGGSNSSSHNVVAGEQSLVKVPSRQASSREKQASSRGKQQQQQQQQSETVSDEKALLASLSARSLTRLRSMHADAEQLLQQMDQLPQQDANEALSARTRTNVLAAAALNDSQVAAAAAGHHDHRQQQQNTATQDGAATTLQQHDGDDEHHGSMASARTRDKLQGLVDESATLLESLGSDGTMNILDTLRDSAGTSPLATLLYGEILQARVPTSLTSDPPAMKRALSAKTRRTLDALLADGKRLMRKLPESESESVFNVLAQHASSSPLASVLLYESLNNNNHSQQSPNSTRPSSSRSSSTNAHDQGTSHENAEKRTISGQRPSSSRRRIFSKSESESSSPPASARTRAALAELMREGDELLSKIKQDQAESVLQTLTESAQNSPLAALVMSQVLPAGDAHAPDAGQMMRSLSARTRKQVQDMVSEGRTLLARLESPQARAVMATLQESASSSPLAAVLQHESVMSMHRVEYTRSADAEALRHALSARARDMSARGRDVTDDTSGAPVNRTSSTNDHAEKMLVDMEQGQDEAAVLEKGIQDRGNVIAAVLHAEVLDLPDSTKPDNIAGSDSASDKKQRPYSGTRAHLLTLLEEGRSLLARASGSGRPASSDRAFGILRAHAPTNAVAAKLYAELMTMKSDDVASAPLLDMHTPETEETTRAECVDRVQTLIDHGIKLVERLDDAAAESLLSTVKETVQVSPVSALLYAQLVTTISGGGGGGDAPAQRPSSVGSASGARGAPISDRTNRSGGHTDSSNVVLLPDSEESLRRAMSAGAREHLDQLMHEGRELISKLETKDVEDVLETAFAAADACSSPLAALVIGETLKHMRELPESELIQHAEESGNQGVQQNEVAETEGGQASDEVQQNEDVQVCAKDGDALGHAHGDEGEKEAVCAHQDDDVLQHACADEEEKKGHVMSEKGATHDEFSEQRPKSVGQDNAGGALLPSEQPKDLNNDDEDVPDEAEKNQNSESELEALRSSSVVVLQCAVRCHHARACVAAARSELQQQALRSSSAAVVLQNAIRCHFARGAMAAIAAAQAAAAAALATAAADAQEAKPTLQPASVGIVLMLPSLQDGAAVELQQVVAFARARGILQRTRRSGINSDKSTDVKAQRKAHRNLRVRHAIAAMHTFGIDKKMSRTGARKYKRTRPVLGWARSTRIYTTGFNQPVRTALREACMTRSRYISSKYATAHEYGEMLVDWDSDFRPWEQKVRTGCALPFRNVRLIRGVLYALAHSNLEPVKLSCAALLRALDIPERNYPWGGDPPRRTMLKPVHLGRQTKRGKVCALQRAYRCHLARKALYERIVYREKFAVSVLLAQRYARKFIGKQRMRVQMKQRLEREKLHAAAVKIQCAMRSHTSRLDHRYFARVAHARRYYMYVRTYVCIVFIFVCVYIYIYICIYVCMYTYV